VIGEGLSVTRFFKAPLETLLPKSENSPSESDFYASLIVIGEGLSVTRFFIAPLVTLLPKSEKSPSESDF
jgi:hypothetical protein